MARRGAPPPAGGVKVVTAAAYARKRRSAAVRFALLGFGLLLGGLFLNGPRTQLFALMALIAGTVLSWIGIALMDRWVAVPKAEDALAGALSDVGPHYTLLNWALPQADHVLIAPWGLVVLHPFNTEGPLAVDGKRWRDHRPLWRRLLSFGRRAIRNPGPLVSADAVALRAALAAALAERSEGGQAAGAGGADAAAARVADPLADVPIATAIVFTRPDMVLETGARPADPPAVRAADLRAWLREAGRAHAALAPTEARRLQAVIADMARGRMGEAGA